MTATDYTRWSDDDDWRDRAACANDPHPECWFAHKADHDARARAVRICLACPVRAECLEDALCHETTKYDRHGIRAALTPNQRTQLTPS